MANASKFKEFKEMGISARKIGKKKFEYPRMTPTQTAWWIIGWEEENDRIIGG